jgi:hypothetical protein
MALGANVVPLAQVLRRSVGNWAWLGRLVAERLG